MLAQSSKFEVMGEASDGMEAVTTAERLLPATQVLMLTASIEKDAVIEAVLAIAAGRLRIPNEALKRTLALVRDELWEKSRRA